MSIAIVAAPRDPSRSARRGRPPVHDDPECRRRIGTCLRLYKAGVPVPALARLFDVSRATVYNWINSATAIDADPAR